MGRLSEYVNGSTSKGQNRNGEVEVYGFIETDEMFCRMMTNDPTLDRVFRKYVKDVLKEARKNLSKDAANYLESDPRKAARAVKFAVYKTAIGGTLSILAKRKSGPKYKLIRHRKLDDNPKQRGGNRRPRIDDGRNRLDYYFGADRGFVLRFISSGTKPRYGHFGNRGMIPQKAWFGHTAPWHIETAAQKVAEAINEYIKHETNG